MLKDEIGESNLRLKAAKHGQSIAEIVPAYDNTYYLPSQEQFQIESPKNSRYGLDRLLNIH